MAKTGGEVRVDPEDGWVDGFCPATLWVGGAVWYGVYDGAVGKYTIFFRWKTDPGFGHQSGYEGGERLELTLVGEAYHV